MLKKHDSDMKITVPLVLEEDITCPSLSIISGENADIASTGAVPNFSSPVVSSVMIECDIFSSIFSVGFMDTTESFREPT